MLEGNVGSGDTILIDESDGRQKAMVKENLKIVSSKILGRYPQKTAPVCREDYAVSSVVTPCAPALICYNRHILGQYWQKGEGACHGQSSILM